jgi:hypothetical protein
MTNAKNIYDVELKEIFRTYCAEIKKVQLTGENKDPEYHIRNFRTTIDFYCEWNGLDFDSTGFIIINQSDNMYRIFLPHYLAFASPELIPIILDYHFEKYKSDEITFPKLVKNVIIQLVRSHSPFDNQDRLDRIVEWLREPKKDAKDAVHNAPVLNCRIDDKKLMMLSKSLFESQYTENKFAFKNALTIGKTITWKKDYSYLIYLLYLLFNQKTSLIYVSGAKSNAYQKAARMLFYNSSATIVSERHIPTIINYITKRRYEKYHPLRKKVEECLIRVGIHFEPPTPPDNSLQ